MAATFEKVQSMGNSECAGRLLCNQCGRTYASKKTLNAHEKKHTGSAPYRCCGKMFWDRTHFYRHRCNRHGEDKNCECSICGHKFSSQNDVNRHKRKVHEEKNIVCSDCSKSFAYQSEYDDHVAGHKGERKHRCQCGKTYVYSQGLSRHKRKCQL